MPRRQHLVSDAMALAQEQLYPRVSTLFRQVERGLLGRPTAPVPAAGARVACQLMAEARRLLGKRLLSIGRFQVNADLAVSLGQVLCALETFEAEHATWSPERRCVCWHLSTGPRPVRRLLTPDMLARTPRFERDPVEVSRVRDKLQRMLLARDREHHLASSRAEAMPAPSPARVGEMGDPAAIPAAGR